MVETQIDFYLSNFRLFLIRAVVREGAAGFTVAGFPTSAGDFQRIINLRKVLIALTETGKSMEDLQGQFA
jgi:hypothetical protein